MDSTVQVNRIQIQLNLKSSRWLDMLEASNAKSFSNLKLLLQSIMVNINVSKI